MLENIPDELRLLPQWVVATGELLPSGKPDKRPLNPRTGLAASCDDPATWGTYDEAEASEHRFKGFMLTEADPYTVIDLDPTDDPDLLDRHNMLYEAFQTYAEFSQSGHGAHLVLRGKLAGGNIQNNRHKVEVYSRSHYIIFTGRVLRTMPITECQSLLDRLEATLRQGETVTTDLEQRDSDITDDEVRRLACSAGNGEKFTLLWEGRWKDRPDLYESQSEADYALMRMLTFWTWDNDQCRRLFRASGLARAKNTDKYLDRMLRKFRGQQAAMKQTAAQLVSQFEVAEDAPAEKQSQPDLNPEDFPAGLIGDAARYIFDSAIRPMPEAALCGALALGAGVAGRAYNISGSGINLFITLVAKTGTGKEGAAKGMNMLVNAIRPRVPAIVDFQGPAMFASGPALLKALDKKPCFVSVIGEYGLFLKRICNPHANGNDLTLRAMMLDLFNKSGKNDVLLPSAYSDLTKSTNPIYGPALTVLGECTPESFYDALGVGAVVDGTLPRQQIVEYLGDRPNANHNPFFAPPTELVNGWANLAAACLQSGGKVNEIAQDPDAKAVLEAFNLDIDQGIRASRDNMVREIGTRAHFRALRLAGLLAVSRDFKSPVVSADDALWACWFVRRGINSLQTRFSDGDVGGGDTKREAEIRRTIREWFTLSKAQKVKYRATPKMIEGGGVPEYYLRKVRQLPCFRDHRNGENFAFRDALKNMDAAEELVCFPSQAAKEQWDTRSTVYSRGPNFTM